MAALSPLDLTGDVLDVQVRSVGPWTVRLDFLPGPDAPDLGAAETVVVTAAMVSVDDTEHDDVVDLDTNHDDGAVFFGHTGPTVDSFYELSVVVTPPGGLPESYFFRGRIEARSGILT